MAGKVFVSYAHADHDFSELLYMQLREFGIDTWVDYLRLSSGDNWQVGIEDAIKSSGVLLLIMSPDSMISPYVTFEWAFAYGVGIKIIPILYRSCDIHPKLKSWHYLDFTHKLHRPWDTLIEQIKSIL